MKEQILNYVRTQHLEVAYLDSPPADKACLLVHGWPDDALTWTNVTHQLEAQGVRCVRPYLRGFGPTKFRNPNSSRSGQLVAMALDLIEFVEALDLRDFVLVGHDWGARISYMLAVRLADRLRGLLCLSVGYGTNDPGQQLSFEQARLYWYHWYFATEQGRRALTADPQGFALKLWEYWSPHYRPRQEEWGATAQSFSNPDWVQVTLHSYRHRWGEAEGDHSIDDEEAYFSRPNLISVPTVVLHGAADGATLPNMSEGKDEFFTNGYVRRVVPAVGHFIQREDPRAVVEAALSFYD